jgi:hypothetical protein
LSPIIIIFSFLSFSFIFSFLFLSSSFTFTAFISFLFIQSALSLVLPWEMAGDGGSGAREQVVHGSSDGRRARSAWRRTAAPTGGGNGRIRRREAAESDEVRGVRLFTRSQRPVASRMSFIRSDYRMSVASSPSRTPIPYAAAAPFPYRNGTPGGCVPYSTAASLKRHVTWTYRSMKGYLYMMYSHMISV